MLRGQALSGAGIRGVGSPLDRVGVFVSFDFEHDADLCERLVEQSSRGTSPFDVADRSQVGSMTVLWEEDLREQIRSADEVIVICGEHTLDSFRMATELRMAQEEGRPYFLLWGRRELMCTRPASARATDSMYSWTWEVLLDQILTLRRLARADGRWERRRAGPTPEVPVPVDAAGATADEGP